MAYVSHTNCGWWHEYGEPNGTKAYVSPWTTIEVGYSFLDRLHENEDLRKEYNRLAQEFMEKELGLMDKYMKRLHGKSREEMIEDIKAANE